jgi:hypothetical protein
MSPVIPARGKKISVPDNLYTALLAIAFLVVFTTVGLVTFLCHAQYGTIFKIASQNLY